MEFWKLCYDLKIIDAEYLKQAVITESNKYGDITQEQYKEIVGVEFSVQ